MKQLLIIIAAVVLVGCAGISKNELLKNDDERPIIFPAASGAGTTTPPRASIHRSARQGEVGYIIQHINAGTDVNEVNNSNGQIALHCASTHNHIPIIKIKNTRYPMSCLQS